MKPIYCIKELLTYIGLIILGFILGFVLEHNIHKDTSNIDNTTTPVEKIVIDTLYITRDNLIKEVVYLDSIKYDTIEKIYELDDSTTIKLFYQLVSE